MNDISLAERRKREAEEKKESEFKALQISKDIQTQMSTANGRRFVWRVLKKLLYGENIANYNATVYGAVAKQEVAREIERELKQACRDEFYQMLTENEKSIT